MASSTRTTRTFNVSFPPDLATQVDKLAKAENRTISELFREAFHSYKAQHVQAVLDEMNPIGKRNHHMSYTEGEVEKLVKETRREIAAERATKKQVRQ